MLHLANQIVNSIIGMMFYLPIIFHNKSQPQCFSQVKLNAQTEGNKITSNKLIQATLLIYFFFTFLNSNF